MLGLIDKPLLDVFDLGDAIEHDFDVDQECQVYHQGENEFDVEGRIRLPEGEESEHEENRDQSGHVENGVETHGLQKLCHYENHEELLVETHVPLTVDVVPLNLTDNFFYFLLILKFLLQSFFLSSLLPLVIVVDTNVDILFLDQLVL